MKQTPTGCKEHSDRLTELLYGELDESTESTLIAHLEVCDRCREELERFEHVRSLMRSARSLEIPAGLEARVMSEARLAIAARAPVPEVSGDEKPTGLWSRLWSPVSLRPVLAAAMTMMLVAGVAYLLAGREGSIVQRYTQKPSTQLPAELSSTPAPPITTTDEIPVEQTMAAEQRAGTEVEPRKPAHLATDDTSGPLETAGEVPAPNHEQAVGYKVTTPGGATGADDKTGFAKDGDGGGSVEDDLMANLADTAKKGGGTKSDLAPELEGTLTVASGAESSSTTAKTASTPAPKPVTSAPAGGYAGLSEGPAAGASPPAPAVSKTPAPSSPLPAPDYYETQPAEVIALDDADEEAPATPADEAGTSGKKKESWLDKWKNKKAEKKAKKKGKGSAAPSASETTDSSVQTAPAKEKAVEQQPSDPFEQAMTLKSSKKYDDAIALLMTIKDKPTATATSQAKVYHQLAACNAQAGQTKKALIYYENLFARFPSYPGRHKAMWDAALLYLTVGDKGPARDLLEKLLDVPAYSQKAQEKLDSIK
jgi:anti-sigma factor (TIGR02949 family)